jgi:hypothetical protein
MFDYYKKLPFARRAGLVLRLAGLLCLFVSLFLDSGPSTRLLRRGLGIATIVLWTVSLILLFRSRVKSA